MPFDAADFDRRDQPTPRPHFWWLRQWIENVVLTFAAISLALIVGTLVGAAVDGFPSPQPIVPDLPRYQGSTIGDIAGTGSFLLLLAGFVWWKVRRDMAE